MIGVLVLLHVLVYFFALLLPEWRINVLYYKRMSYTKRNSKIHMKPVREIH